MLCRFTFAGTVEAFDQPHFRYKLLRLNSLATDLRDMRVSPASVAVEATLVYSSASDAASDATRLYETSAVELGRALGETVETHSAEQVTIDAAPPSMPPPAPPPLPSVLGSPQMPPTSSLELHLQKWLILGCFLVITVILVALATTLAHCVFCQPKKGGGHHLEDITPPAHVRRQSSVLAVRSPRHPSTKRYASFGAGAMPAAEADAQPALGTDERGSWVTVSLSPVSGKVPPPNAKALERAKASRATVRNSPVRLGANYV